MEKIITRAERSRKTKRNQFILIVLGGFLILLMVLGTFGYSLMGNSRNTEEDSQKIDYNGIVFMQKSGYWSFEVDGNSFATKYNPNEVKDIGFLSFHKLNDYAGKPLYFVTKNRESMIELGANLNPFVQRIHNACLSEEDCEEDLPIKNCSIDNIIVIKEPKNESNNIYQEENCIFITADYENQTRYSDVLLFNILEIR